MPTHRWAAHGSAPCRSGRGRAHHCPAPRTEEHCGHARPPAAPTACWGAAGDLGEAKGWEHCGHSTGTPSHRLDLPPPRTSLLCGHHEGFGCLSPALAGLCCDAEEVGGLGLQAGGRVLPCAGAQHLTDSRVGRGGVKAVGELVRCRDGGGTVEDSPQHCPLPPPPSLPRSEPAVRGSLPDTFGAELARVALRCSGVAWSWPCPSHTAPGSHRLFASTSRESQHGHNSSHLPRMTPLGAVGGCQMSRTEVVLTSGNSIPTGGPGTGMRETGFTMEHE